MLLDSSNRLLLPLGNMSIEGLGSERTLTLTPAPEQSGATKVMLRVVDTDNLIHDEEFEFVVHAVNDAPLVSPVPNQTFVEDSQYTVEGLIILDAESPPESLKVSFRSDLPQLIAPEDIQVERVGLFARLRLTPKPNQHGVARVTIIITDPQGENGEESFQARVLPVNDPPFATSFKVVTGAGIPALFTLKGSDPDGDALRYEFVSLPTRGRIEGTPPHLTYIPAGAATGEDRLTYAVTDGSLRSSPVQVDFRILQPGQMRRFSTLSKPAAPGQPVVLNFFAVAGKRYFLEVSDSLNQGTWIVLRTFISEEGGEVILSDDTRILPQARFYRIRKE